MTDYEIISLVNEQASMIEAHFMNFVTIYFAVVVASYFVAARLPWPILVAVLTMFTGFTVLNLSVVQGLVEQQLALLSHYGTQSESLHPLWRGETDWGVLAVAGPVAVVAIYFLGYISAIGFALYMKRRRQTEL